MSLVMVRGNFEFDFNCVFVCIDYVGKLSEFVCVESVWEKVCFIVMFFWWVIKGKYFYVCCDWIVF